MSVKLIFLLKIIPISDDSTIFQKAKRHFVRPHSAPLKNRKGITKYMLSVKIEGTTGGINPIICRMI